MDEETTNWQTAIYKLDRRTDQEYQKGKIQRERLEDKEKRERLFFRIVVNIKNI